MLDIYKASAGSGKTFQLAGKYIRLLLGYSTGDRWHFHNRNVNSHRHILAITFTNKATAEMKKRIVEELARLADPEKRGSSKYLKDFMRDFKASRQEIGEKAREALKNLLSSFRYFNVSTIDSFFQTVLRQFAHELDLDGNFDLRLDDEQIIEVAVEDLLLSINGTSHLLDRDLTKKELADTSKWLFTFMESKMRDGKSFNVFSDTGRVRAELVSFIGKLINERFRLHRREIIAWCDNHDNIVAFEETCRNEFKKIRAQLRADAKKIKEKIAEAEKLTNNGKIISGNSGLMSLVDPLLKQADNYPDISFGKTARNAIDHGDCSKIFLKDFRSSFPDSPLYQEVMSYLCSLETKYKELTVYHLLLKNIYPLGLFSEIIKRMEAYRKNEGQFLLSDTNEFLHNIINNEESPFIYERLGGILNNFLLDEFQDTSQLQWSNLRPLLRESLATYQENLIIGDEKQCIYRFRNSDPSLINSGVKKDLIQFNDRIKERGAAIDENTNWRSSPLIVRFNNSLFASMAYNMGLGDYYANAVQKPAKDEKKLPGYVDMLFSPGTGDTVDEYRCSFNTTIDKEFKDNELVALDRMAVNIERQLNSGYRPADIAVLVRKTAEGEKAIRYLLEAIPLMDIPVRPQIVSSDSLKLGESPLIKYVISRLKLIATPEISEKPEEEQGAQDISVYNHRRYRKLRSLFNNFNLYNRGSFDAEGSTRALMKALQFETEEDFCFNADDNGGEKKDDIFSLCRNIIRDYLLVNGNRVDEISANENIYIATFLDKVLEQESLSGTNIVTFLKWWDNSGCDTSVHLPENPNAITVMTIHKSKGLEFDCVHIPFVDYGLHSSVSHGEHYWFKLNLDNYVPRDIMPPLLPVSLNTSMENNEVFNTDYQRIREEDELDALNILYVAFTRAIRELIVSVNGNINVKDGKYSYISQRLYETIRNYNDGIIEDMDPEEYESKKEFIENLNENFDGSKLILGEITKHLVDNKEAKNTGKEDIEPEILSMPLQPLTKKVDITENTRPLGHEHVIWNDPRSRGRFLHEIMQNIYYLDDIDYAIKKCCYAYKLSKSQIEETRRIIHRAFDLLKKKEWFEGFSSLLNEIPVYRFEGDDDEKQKRPDRVVIYEDGSIDVIDYKFGDENRGYKSQVKGYVKFFRQAGYPETKGYIWYLKTGEIEEVG